MTTTLSTYRLRGITGILAAVPAIVGFNPTDSYVLLCVQPIAGQAFRIGPGIRTDLVLPAHRREFCQQLARQVSALASTVVALVYRRRGGRTDLKELRTACDKAGLEVLDAICVNGRIAYSQQTRQTVPVPDAQDEQVQGMTQMLAFRGRRVLPDRQTLRAGVEFSGDIAQAETLTDEVLDVLAAELAELDRDCCITRRLIELALATLAAAADHHEAHRAGSQTAIRLAILVCSPTVRDALIPPIVAEHRQYMPVLTEAVAAVPDQLAANLAVLTAICAYRCGDGALANIALERCLRAEPKHRLGTLIGTAMSSGLPPEFLDELATTVCLDEPGASCERCADR